VAEEATDEAFMALWARIQAGEQIDNPLALLRAITHNKAVSAVRARVARSRIETPIGGLCELAALSDRRQDEAFAEGRELTYADVVFTEGLDSAVRGLEEPERDAFILTELRGLTTREAADVLDTSPMTVSRRSIAARTTIREEITA
jgi:RNA polymerase sigma factor (sigma-70 family)